MSKIVVVGANHAGTACIKTMLSNYKENEVVVFDANSNISFLGCGMALWIGNQIHKPDGLFYSDKAELESMGARVYMNSPVVDIDFESKKITANVDGKEMVESYDKLVLATGSLPIIPEIPGKDLENVQQVKLFQNAQEVIDKLQDTSIKNVVVVGAGYIGVELAEAFQRHGKNTTLVDVANQVLGTYYDEEFTSLMGENLKNHGINLALGQKVTALLGDTKVESVVTDKETIKADMVILSIGFRPNTFLGKDSIKTFRNGAYLVDRHQETSIKDVYAIGDCATVYDNSIGEDSYIALATNAVRSGIVAAHNACGTVLDSIGVQGSNGISIYGLNMLSTGITLAKAKRLGLDVLSTDYSDLQKPEFIETENPEVKIRIVYDKKTRAVLGAQLASKHDISLLIHMFSLAIQEKTTIDTLKLLDIMFLPHFNKPYNYVTMCALGAK